MSDPKKRWFPWNVSRSALLWGVGLAMADGILLAFVSNSVGRTIVIILITSSLGQVLKLIWGDRHPYQYPPGPKRSIRWIPHFRDEMIFKEGERSATIYTGLQIYSDEPKEYGRDINACSPGKWNPPFDTEPMPLEKHREIIKLLCDMYDKSGTRYTVNLGAELAAELSCPVCRHTEEYRLPVSGGNVVKAKYHVGMYYDWGVSTYGAGRPENGSAKFTSDQRCSSCHYVFRITTHIRQDVIESVETSLIE